MNSLLKTLRNKSQQESENRLMVQWRDYQIKKGQNERLVDMAIDQTILQGSITVTALNINMQDILVRYSNKD
jgi:hypothetical protein